MVWCGVVMVVVVSPEVNSGQLSRLSFVGLELHWTASHHCCASINTERNNIYASNRSFIY